MNNYIYAYVLFIEECLPQENPSHHTLPYITTAIPWEDRLWCIKKRTVVPNPNTFMHVGLDTHYTTRTTAFMEK